MWHPDTDLHHFNRARRICREAARQANDGKLQVALSANQKIAAVTTMVRPDRRTVATTDQWDRDPWLLNMPGRVVDLRTGEMREHDVLGKDYLTKLTAVTADDKCPIPRNHHSSQRRAGGLPAAHCGVLLDGGSD